ncbi:zinc finger, CCHC-type containing protein [Tanacetum coccineum]|uniref:Zinc finger, CCHC-type containing protein n=1 Tax=Tanacetum coccineum TaxID=301880 RepID=A0ABQ5DNS5_9ASTR
MAARGQNQGKGKHKLAYAPKPKILPPPKWEDLAKDSICHECGEIGHWKRNCPQFLAELLKKKKNAASGAGGSEQPLPPPPVALEGQQVAPKIIATHNAWIKGSKEIVRLMLMTMKPEIQRNLENLHANDMLKELKTLFAQQAEQELLQTMRDFHSCKKEEG